MKVPKFTFTSPATGQPIDYFEVDIKPLTRQQYPTLQPARMVGYDGVVPGNFEPLTDLLIRRSYLPCVRLSNTLQVRLSK